MYGPGGPSFAELMRQALSSTRGGYDLLAPKFDHTPFRTPDDLIARVFDRLERRPTYRALDLCCGTGAALAALGPIADVAIGVDFSPGMIAAARSRLEGRDVHLVRGDALALPFADGAFDLVVTFGAMGHFEPSVQSTLFAEVARVLAPGGRFVTVTSDRPAPWRRTWWMLRGFNAVMHLRNALVEPPFVMYYLKFDLPVAVARLVEAGLDPQVFALGDPEHPSLRLLVGHKPT